MSAVAVLAPWLAPEAVVPALAVLAGAGGVWLQLAWPPASLGLDDPALLALLVA